MLLYYAVGAAALVWWYRGAMRKIEVRHEVEMKRITDEYKERVNQIQISYEQETEKSRERYKQAVLKYDLMRTIKE
jgi:hypothetical protein